MNKWQRQFPMVNLALLAAATSIGIALWLQVSVPAAAQTPPEPTPAQPQNPVDDKPPQATLPSSGQPDAIAPGPANLPTFAHGNPQETMRYYIKQIAGSRIPTLDDYQKLLTLPEAKDFKFPMPIGPGHFVMSMCLDHQNNVWVGTEGEGLYRFTPADGMWTQFVATKNPPQDDNDPIPDSAVECGMGDNFIYALACDQQGRVWIGHLNHGISVFNGEKFQSYEVVAGLSRPDSLNGPLGERIFHITAAPQFASASPPTFHDSLTGKDSDISGSIWMCTSAGLAVYFPKTDTWSYITRADGMPSDQANSLAFAADGTLYVATQCDGIAIASPEDHYQSFKQIAHRGPAPSSLAAATLPAFSDAPTIPAAPGEVAKPKPKSEDPLTDDLPTTPTGSGLPSNLLNDILVAKNGSIYAATDAGLAWSTDKGATWQFVRGADWVDKVKNRVGGPPKDWPPPTNGYNGGAILAEDYTTALAEDIDGNLLVGHRAVRGDSVGGNKQTKFDLSAKVYVTSFSSVAGSPQVLRGTYGDGISELGAKTMHAEPPVAQTGKAPMPLGAAASSPAALMARLKIWKAQPANDAVALDDDWATQGDWVGHFGRLMTALFAMGSPNDHTFVRSASKYSYTVSLNSDGGRDGVRSWVDAVSTRDAKALYDPKIGIRRIASIDDHGEVFSAVHDGPGLNLGVSIPAGLHRVAIYCMNERGHTDYGRNRDYLIELRKAHEDGDGVLARTRAVFTSGGVYKQFVLMGPGKFVVRINRNFSFNTICSGLFVDPLTNGLPPQTGEPLPWMGNVRLAPTDGQPSTEAPMPLELGQLGDFANGSATASADWRFGSLMLFRSAVSEGVSAAALKSWSWNLRLWSVAERDDVQYNLAAAWTFLQQNNPILQDKKIRPSSPGQASAQPEPAPPQPAPPATQGSDVWDWRQMLQKYGDKYSLYFTIERDGADQNQDMSKPIKFPPLILPHPVKPPVEAPKNAAAAIELIRTWVPEADVTSDAKLPAIIHIREKTWAKRDATFLDQKLSLKFDGDVEGLIAKLAAQSGGKFQLNRAGAIGDMPYDTSLKTHIDVNDVDVRTILSSGIPPHTTRILWEAEFILTKQEHKPLVLLDLKD